MYKTANTKNTVLSTHPSHSRPITIPIVKKTYNNNNNITDCELKLNFFDPDKCSPPNSWNTRLLHRLNSNSIRNLNTSLR